MQKQVLVSRLRPNPFREMDRYEIQRDKVEALRESFRTTGFWGNVVAREVKGGFFEIAYGHHRLAALKEEHGERQKVPIIVQKLSDESMLKMMIRENMQEYRSSVWVDLESVRATVKAFGNGVVTLELPSSTNNKDWRYAPSFIYGHGKRGTEEYRVAYTATTVATFLGWINSDNRATPKTKTLLNALELIEMGAAQEALFRGKTLDDAEIIVRNMMQQVRLHKKEPAKAVETAKRVGKAASRELTEKKKLRVLEKATKKATRKETDPRKKRLPDIEVFAERIGSKINDLLAEETTIVIQLEDLLKFKKELSAGTKKDLAKELRELSKRAVLYANKFLPAEQKLIVGRRD